MFYLIKFLLPIQITNDSYHIDSTELHTAYEIKVMVLATNSFSHMGILLAFGDVANGYR